MHASLLWVVAVVCTLAASQLLGADVLPGASPADPNQIADLPFEPGALEFSNIYSLLQQDPNLTGHGVRIAAICPSQSYVNNRPQNDYRFNMNHASLYGAQVQFTDGTDGRFGISSHATAIAGVLLGLDKAGQSLTGDSFEYRGACPGALVTVHEFWRFAMVHLYGKRAFATDLITLSLGEMYETWWTRAIEEMAARTDTLVIASVGNGAGVLTPKPLYPGAGSNVLGVGVVDSIVDSSGNISLRQFSQVHGEHSSAGPTDDLRCKPDLVAPGTALVPLFNGSSGYDVVENWSSLSAPIVCGTAALLLEKADNDNTLKNAMTDARALVLKSILMNSARKLPYWHKGAVGSQDDHEIPLDYLQGAGLLDAAAAYSQLAAGPKKPGVVPADGWDSRVLEKDGWGYEYAFAVTEPNDVITATLCWNRAYSDIYPYSRQMDRDADLRFELWGIDANDVTNETLLDYSDSVNDNIEHIYAKRDPKFTDYAIRVRFNPNLKPAVAQRFALAWSIGSDRQAADPWWYDVNGDSVMDASDQLAYAMLDKGLIAEMEPAILEQLKLTRERIALLSSHWSIWKPYLALYEQADGSLVSQN